MREFVIFTDSATDITSEMANALGVKTVQLEVIMDGAEPLPNDCVEPKAFYADLRAKKGATTAAVNIDRFLETFGKCLEEQDVDILYLGFSSGLSGTFNAGAVALKELSEKYAVDIVASGGVSTLSDVEELAKMNIYGAIIGKAYYTGAINISDAVEVAKKYDN